MAGKTIHLSYIGGYRCRRKIHIHSQLPLWLSKFVCAGSCAEIVGSEELVFDNARVTEKSVLMKKVLQRGTPKDLSIFLGRGKWEVLQSALDPCTSAQYLRYQTAYTGSTDGTQLKTSPSHLQR